MRIRKLVYSPLLFWKYFLYSPLISIVKFPGLMLVMSGTARYVFSSGLLDVMMLQLVSLCSILFMYDSNPFFVKNLFFPPISVILAINSLELFSECS